MSGLTLRQERFVSEYIVDLNATQAAIRAGYSRATAAQQGERLLRNVEIAEAVEQALKARSERTGITADRVLTELAKIGFSDIRKVVSWRGSLTREEDNPDGGDVLVIKEIVTNHVKIIDSDQIDDETAAAISEVSQTKDGGLKIKLHDKRAALVDIGKHLGMFKDKVEVTGKDGAPLVEAPDAVTLARQIAFVLASGAAKVEG